MKIVLWLLKNSSMTSKILYPYCVVVGWKEPIDLPIARCDTTILFKSCDVVVAGQTTMYHMVQKI